MKHWRPGGLDPLEHNRIVARRKKYRTVARQFRAAGRSGDRAAASFRMLAVAAAKAADSLRDVGAAMRGALERANGPER